MNKEGKFIVFEGICCSGKTTIAKHMTDYFGGVYGKASPSNLAIGTLLREKYQFNYNLSDSFYVADLIAYTKDFLSPKINKGEIVFQDRYSDSILAYSNSCNRLNKEDSYSISNHINFLKAKGFILTPDLYVYFFADKETIISRMNKEASPIHDFYLNHLTMIDLMFEEYDKIISEIDIEVIKIDTTKCNISQTLKILKKHF